MTGHFPLCTTELLDVPFTTLTLLRDPVERTLSYLRHHRAMTPSEGERPLEEIYADPVRFELLHNHMVKMLSLTPVGDERRRAQPHRVHAGPARAVPSDASREIDVVGFQEDFEQFCDEARARDSVGSSVRPSS